MDEFGARLEDARRRRLLTQAELATKAGISLIQVARLENQATANPRASTVKALAEALDIDPAWLLFGDDTGKAAA
jgi:transcriptional regulator with XRE-family HTH domain